MIGSGEDICTNGMMSAAQTPDSGQTQVGLLTSGSSPRPVSPRRNSPFLSEHLVKLKINVMWKNTAKG